MGLHNCSPSRVSSRQFRAGARVFESAIKDWDGDVLRAACFAPVLASMSGFCPVRCPLIHPSQGCFCCPALPIPCP